MKKDEKYGYLTVNELIEKLQGLKEKGYGDELIGNDFEHYQFCDYDSMLKYVIVQ